MSHKQCNRIIRKPDTSKWTQRNQQQRAKTIHPRLWCLCILSMCSWICSSDINWYLLLSWYDLFYTSHTVIFRPNNKTCSHSHTHSEQKRKSVTSEVRREKHLFLTRFADVNPRVGKLSEKLLGRSREEPQEKIQSVNKYIKTGMRWQIQCMTGLGRLLMRLKKICTRYRIKNLFKITNREKDGDFCSCWISNNKRNRTNWTVNQTAEKTTFDCHY